MQEKVIEILQETAALHVEMTGQADAIAEAAQCIARALSDGRCLYVMGNGGSAADAQHMAGELVGRFELERRPLRCVALTTDTSIITSVGNSTSGNSVDVNLALEEARRLGAVTIGLTGRSGGAMKALCETTICVPSDSTPRIQEVHQTVIHILCRLVERQLAAP
jgi:D-sedoheptulose 7-phosphate isomerase